MAAKQQVERAQIQRPVAEAAGRKVRLIVNADDFGASTQVNEAVIRAYGRGMLTACSLMVSGHAFEDAVRLARENQGLAVGIHLVTVLGRSVLPPAKIPSIVDANGNFPSDPALAGLRYFFSMRSRRELVSELEAQFEKFAATGLPFSHIDSHLHLHVHPVVFEAALRLGERYGVRRMRVPLDDYRLFSNFHGGGSFAGKAMAAVFRLLTARMKRRLRARGFTWARRVYGHFQSNRMSADYVHFVLEHLREETNEIYFHPACFETCGGTETAPEEEALRKEYDILVNPKVLAHAKALGIELTNYRGIERNL